MIDKCLYHVYHDQKWGYTSNGAKNNVAIWYKQEKRIKDEGRVIPLDFCLFWAGPKLSYLRYLTFKTLRHFHPESNITLFISENYNKSIQKWNVEKQDFLSEDLSVKNYIDELDKLRIKKIKMPYVVSANFCPILQSDILRWVWLRDYGGFYLDTDQIVCKSFDSLPRQNKFIYSNYKEEQCGDYYPVGLLGVQRGYEIAKRVIEEINKTYTENNYNSSGIVALLRVCRQFNMCDSFNAPYEFFYPVNSSNQVKKIYNGEFKITDKSYACHWFGGHPLSQEFNKKYTESFAQTSNDSLSVFLRENKII